MAAVLAAFCAAVFAGCSVKFGTNPQVSPETVVAKPTRMSFTGELEITFKEFNSEYLFYLNSYGITEDPSNADMCRELRETIINNIIYDKVLLLKAKEYGCDELTDKEKEEVQSDFEEEIQLQIKDLGVAVVRCVHGFQRRILIQHMAAGFHPVILHRNGLHPDPAVAHGGGQLHLRIGSDLAGNGFPFACLDIQPAFKEVDGTEGPHPRLIPIHRRQVIGLAIL